MWVRAKIAKIYLLLYNIHLIHTCIHTHRVTVNKEALMSILDFSVLFFFINLYIVASHYNRLHEAILRDATVYSKIVK